MTQSNISILRNYLDEVINQKQTSLLPKYVSEKFTGHGSSFVGMGLMYDASSQDKIIVKAILAGSPADGKLMVGDEIVRAQDGSRVWDRFDTLRNGSLWGQGAVGTPITVRVRRDGSEEEVTLMRGMVSGFKYDYHDLEMGSRDMFNEWPDLKTNVVNAIESGDLVAYQLENHGKNSRFQRSAVWSEFGFVRIQDGKITDWWSSDDPVSQYKQLGFTIWTPEMVKA